jgi:hypothetical protein
MTPRSREQLKEYALRKLGAPVIEINVDDAQLEDRIDDALQMFAEYHFDGVQRAFYRYIVKEEDRSRGYIDTDSLVKNDGAIGPEISNGNQIISVLRIFEFTESGSSNMFSVPYQIALNDMYGLRAPGSLINYTMTQQHLELMRDYLDPEKMIRFSRVTNRIYIDMNWEEDIDVGNTVIVECYVALDPNEFPEIYNDILLKKYVVSSFKQQWGQNLSKYQNVTLPGGLSYNGAEIYQQASDEMDKIEESLSNKYELPPDFFVG